MNVRRSNIGGFRRTNDNRRMDNQYPKKEFNHFEQNSKMPRAATAFTSEKNLIRFLNSHLESLDPKRIYRKLDQFEFVIQFLLAESSNKGLQLLIKIYGSKILDEYSFLEEKSAIYLLLFEKGRFRLEKQIMNLFRNSIISDPNIVPDLIQFYGNVARAVPHQIPILRKMFDIPEHILKVIPEIKNMYAILIKELDQIENNLSNDLKLYSEIYPTAQQINPGSGFLFLENKFKEGYKTTKLLVNTLISLELENFVIPIRKGLANLINGELDPRDLYLYENVCLFGATSKDIPDATNFLHFEIRVPPNTKKTVFIDWLRSDRLNNNSFLILSKSPFCKTVEALCLSKAKSNMRFQESREYVKILNNGIVPVQLIKGSIIPGEKYYMFEGTEIFFVHEFCLRSLQTINTRSFPNLKQALIYHKFGSNLIKTSLNYDYSVIYLPESKYFGLMGRNISTLPDEYKDRLLRVDHEQFDALFHFLNYSLTLVNGHPGSGKTHLAREIVRVLGASHISSPVFLIAQTNHSIDAFLEGIIQFVDNKNIIRLGGKPRTNDKKILDRMMQRKWVKDQLKENDYFKLSKLVDSLNMKMQICNLILTKFASINIQVQKIGSQKGKADYLFQELFPILSKYFHVHEILHKLYRLPFPKYFIINLAKKYIPNDQDYWNFWLLGNFQSKMNSILNENKQLYFHNRFTSLDDSDDSDEYDDEYDDDNDDEYDDTELSELLRLKYDENSNEQYHFGSFFPSRPKSNPQIKNKTNSQNENPDEEQEERDDIDFIQYMSSIRQSSQVIQIDDKIDYDVNPFFETDRFIPMIVHFIRKNGDPIENALMLMSHIAGFLSNTVNELIHRIDQQKNEMREVENKVYGKFFKQHRFIGMTSTLACIYKKAIEISGCEYMIIEEAGELTEATTMGIIPNTIQHLIMIGDYNQLRPKVEWELINEKNPRASYDISTFERLVRAQLNAKTHPDLFTLTVQRRMHPEISSLLRNNFQFCADIKDAPETQKHYKARGMLSNISFVLHDEEESSQENSRSKTNDWEADYCAHLVLFYLFRGFEPKDITVITLYKGQMMLVREKLSFAYNRFKQKGLFNDFDPFLNQSLRDVTIQCIDNFQGEENKVTIISITATKKIGFVKTINRILVTLSRARNVLCVVGNEKILRSPNSSIWPNIIKYLEKTSKYIVAPGIWISGCKHAPENKLLRNTADLILNRFSPCREKCEMTLPCGHQCNLHCHYDDHTAIPCQQPSNKTCPNCHNTYECKCGLVDKYRCPIMRNNYFPECKHTCLCKCCEITDNTAKCTHACDHKLQCGHKCTLKCGHSGNHICTHVDIYHCDFCGRNSTIKCPDIIECKYQCSTVFPCGHRCDQKCCKCSTLPQHLHICHKDCNYVFPCGHQCQMKCSNISDQHQHLVCNECIKLKPIKSNYTAEDAANNYTNPKFKCTKKCPACGAECMCLKDEKCFFKCEHNNFRIQPPQEDNIMFCFPCGHIEALSAAKARINNEIQEMLTPDSERYDKIHYPTCPRRCQHVLTQSNVFANEINIVQDILHKYWQKTTIKLSKISSSKDKSKLRDKWFCYQCQCGCVCVLNQNKLIQKQKDNKTNDLIYNCPKCNKEHHFKA